MTWRLLPEAEWPRLAGTELEAVYPHLDPKRAAVMVVEQDGAIVACWAGLWIFHVEGLWIHPDHQKRGSVARRLLAAMRWLTGAMGVRNVATAAQTDEVRALLASVQAVPLPGDHFVFSLCHLESHRCPQPSPFH